MLRIDPDGKAWDYEIKISRGDFRADFKKFRHFKLALTHKGVDDMAHDRVNRVTFSRQVAVWDYCRGKGYVPFEGHARVPNRFYYVCPSDLIRKDEVPPHAGLLYIRESGGWDVIKRGPVLTTELELDWKVLAQKAARRYWKQSAGEDKNILQGREIRDGGS